MLAERVEVRLKARQGDPCGLQAPVVGDGEEQAPAGLEHAPQLVQRLADVGDVLEHLGAPHEVDRAVGERDRPVLEQEHLRSGHVRARPPRRLLAQLDAHGIVEQGEKAPGPAAEVEHAVAGLDLVEQKPAPQLPGVGLGILRRVGPERLVERSHPLS